MLPVEVVLDLSPTDSDQALMTKPGSLALMTLLQDDLALSKVNLFKSPYVANGFSTKAELDAAVADFDGYAEGTITAFSAPLYDPSGGASMNGGVLTFAYDTTGDGNTVNGWWIESAAGAVIAAGNFTDPVLVNAPGDGVSLVLVVRIPNS